MGIAPYAKLEIGRKGYPFCVGRAHPSPLLLAASVLVQAASIQALRRGEGTPPYGVARKPVRNSRRDVGIAPYGGGRGWGANRGGGKEKSAS